MRIVTRRVAIASLTLCCALAIHKAPRAAQEPDGAVRFAVIGDFGTGSQKQYELAKVMAGVHARSPYEMVLTVGDNIYGSWSPRSIAERFETPYRPLLDARVRFFASLGNHDGTQERQYAPFNMRGERYYRFTRANVEFFALDSNYMDAAQLAWLRGALDVSTATWKIAFFHHPLYSSGERHGSETDLRTLLEPLFVRYHVQAVFSGHDHVYERIKPQQGVTYFVCGSAGQLRRGDLDRASPVMAAGFDEDQAFMIVEVNGDRLHFDAISRTDVVVDSGEITRVTR